MKRSGLLFLSILSGCLMIPAWYEFSTGLILLFAMVPLLFVEDYYCRNKAEHRPHKVFLMASVSFFTWNLGTTWWLWNATEIGMFVAMTINTALMSTVFWLFHVTHRNAGKGPGYFGLIVYWLVFEHFYMNGEINWPWLNLGNGLANDIYFIQWYEYTGAFGGTLWILTSNILAFFVLRQIILHGNLKGKMPVFIALCCVVLIPVIASLVIYTTYREKHDPREIVIVQPNIDPYNEKFGGMEMTRQMDIMIGLGDSLATDSTDYIVAPETFINDNIWEDQIYRNKYILTICNYLYRNHPGASFVVGITFSKMYRDPEEKTPTAREIQGTGYWYDSFNAAIQIDTTLKPQVYKKSKLVVGVEKMPYPQYLGFLRKLTLRLGGTFRSLGTQESRENFFSQRDSTQVAPVICYESVFGQYVTDYVRKGANLIFVITNDGWWGDTPGYRQHFSFSRLRAIETRRSVARSANTGISSFINQKGEILQRTAYWVPASIRGEINANDKMTFYVKNGDYIPGTAYFFSLLVLLLTLTRILISRKQ